MFIFSDYVIGICSTRQMGWPAAPDPALPTWVEGSKMSTAYPRCYRPRSLSHSMALATIAPRCYRACPDPAIASRVLYTVIMNMGGDTYSTSMGFGRAQAILSGFRGLV